MFLMLPYTILCKSMQEKSKLQTCVKGIVDFGIISVKYCIVMKD